MKIRRTASLALLLTFTPIALPLGPFASGIAHAQDDATTKAARARFQEGVEYYDKGSYEAARASFLQAYALRKHPAVLLNLAQSSLRSGHTLDAARYFQQYLREAPSISAGQRNDAERGLAEARAKLGRIVVDAPSGEDVTVDDDRVGVAPLRDPVDVEPGPHTVKVRGDAAQVTVAAGQQVTAHVGGDARASASPAPAVTTPSTSAPAESHEASVTPASPEAVPPPNADKGTEGGGFFSAPDSMAPVYVGGIVALAGFGSAVGFYFAKKSAQSSADDIATQIVQNLLPGQKADGICNSTAPADVRRYGQACAALKSENDKVDKDALAANISLGVGIAATAFTVIYWGVASKEESKRSAMPTFSPMVGPRVGGLVVTGGF